MKVDRRLFSLDILRGLDMFLLAVVGPFAAALNSAISLPDCVVAQFHHAWGGFTLWDIIMPLFIFMSGAAVPFALGKRMESGRAGWAFWRHVLLRFAMLWILGMVAQGRLLTMNPAVISPFNNTLQSIACGYLACALALQIPSRVVRASLPAVLAVLYALVLHFCGDYSAGGNAAAHFERWIVPYLTPDCSKVLDMADPGYTWWATIPMFASMGLCGMLATEILRSGAASLRSAVNLAVLGAGLLAFGWALSPWIPPIKHIYTLTFTAQAMGWCMLALASLFYILDVLLADSERLRKCLWLFTLFGRASLLAYLCEGVFRPVFKAFGGIFAPAGAHLLGERWVPMVVWFFASLLLVLVLHVRIKLHVIQADSSGR